MCEGEVVLLKHVSRGQDVNGTLHTDVIVSGSVPSLAESSRVTVLPYVEQLVQTAPGECTVITLMTQVHQVRELRWGYLGRQVSFISVFNRGLGPFLNSPKLSQWKMEKLTHFHIKIQSK